MNRRTALLLLGAGALSSALAGCTSFTPVYGDASPVSTARFNFAEPGNRLEQIILQRLQVAFPGPATPADPVLKVTASTAGIPEIKSDAYDVGIPVPVRVEATVSITRGDQVLLQATRFTDTAYQGEKLSPTNAASLIGAQETAARSTAESLRAAILAGYRP
jgi:hypothetical protein